LSLLVPGQGAALVGILTNWSNFFFRDQIGINTIHNKPSFGFDGQDSVFQVLNFLSMETFVRGCFLR
jgi:hypothetical protein